MHILGSCAPRLGAAGARLGGPVDGGSPRSTVGCIFFGISAIAGYVVPRSGSVLDLAAADWNTSLGAACSLACAPATLSSEHTLKSPRRLRLHERSSAGTRGAGTCAVERE